MPALATSLSIHSTEVHFLPSISLDPSLSSAFSTPVDLPYSPAAEWRIGFLSSLDPPVLPEYCIVCMVVGVGGGVLCSSEALRPWSPVGAGEWADLRFH